MSREREPGPTDPISLRTAARLLGWGDSRAAENRLRVYLDRRVASGAPDPRLRAGRLWTVTVHRLAACLPELDALGWALVADGEPAPRPNQLLALIRRVARAECRKLIKENDACSK